MVQVILISQLPLPYHKIGSWTTMYGRYLKNDHNIDHVICAEPQQRVEGVNYHTFDANNVGIKVKKKLTKNPYQPYLDQLKKIVKPDHKYVIQLVDNHGLSKALETFIQENFERDKFYIQFFYHGYPPFYGNFESRPYFNFIDELVLLTYDSYKEHKAYYTIMPCRCSILYNGIDTSQFTKVSSEEKEQLKAKHGVTGKKVFLWVSQDRPKKGLDLVLDAWKRIKNRKDAILWVIGIDRSINQEDVKVLGRIDNDKLPEYYQASDVYLFSPLNHEGFGLTLAEALQTGCHCIASSIGGVPEVLQYGKYGTLIENPHFISEWVEAIQEAIEETREFDIPEGLYSSINWERGMNQVIDNAKRSLS